MVKTDEFSMDDECISQGLRIIKPNKQKPEVVFKALVIRDKLIILMHLCGHTNKEICAYFHLHRNTVSKIVKKTYEEYPRLISP